jgi:(1->4)-alpha-D-glucan 1-alpha-D-glucosylmutase
MIERENDPVLSEFKERMQRFLTKALRESKRRSKWIEPNEAYEAASHRMVERHFAPGSTLLQQLRPIAAQVAFQGALNSLIRAILKCTLPGIPDIYQGTELWDFSFVDPDNRRPVDYDVRSCMLDDERPLDDLIKDWRSGSIKQRLFQRLLADRREKPLLYAEGDYQPLYAKGVNKTQIVGFTRKLRKEVLVVILPRFINNNAAPFTLPLGADFWDETSVEIEPNRWFDVISYEERVFSGEVKLADLFSHYPFAVLRNS